MHFNELLSKWLETRNGEVMPSTFTRYQSVVRSCRDMNMILEFVNAPYLQDKVDSMIKAQYSTSVIHQNVHVWRSAIRYAVDHGMMRWSAVSYCELLRVPRTIKRCTPHMIEDVDGFVSACQNWDGYGDLFLFLLYTGLKVGEAIALKWSDLSDNGDLVITRTDYRGKIQIVESASNYRVIPLSKDALSVLDHIRRFSVSPTWIFTRKRSKRETERAYYRVVLKDWDRLTEYLGYDEHIGIYTLRYTYTARALNCGVSAITLGRLLGSNDINELLRRYSGGSNLVSGSALKEAAAQVTY